MNTTPTFSRLDPGQRREQILDAANALFAERAYDEVSIEDIARSAGVTRGLVHHYFGGRKEVYIALLERLGAVRENNSRRPQAAALARAWPIACRAGSTGPRPTARSGSPRSRAARTSPTPTSGASSPTSCAAQSRCSPPTTPTSLRTHHGCATRSSAGPGSTAPRRDAGYAARPPAKRHTNCSPRRSNTSYAHSAPHPRQNGAHLAPERRPEPFGTGALTPQPLSSLPQLWIRVKVVPHRPGSANSASASRRSKASSSSLNVSRRRDSSATLN